MTAACPFPEGSIESSVLMPFLQALQMTGQKSPDEIAALWHSYSAQFQLSETVLERIWATIQEHCNLKSTPSATAELTPPRLHVDLGTDVAIGHALEIEFHLICPGYQKGPKVLAQLSGTLDRTHWKEQPRLVQEEPGYWKFYETCALNDPRDPHKPCAPGSYRVELEVSFPDAPPGSLGREMRASLRFSVPDPEKSASNTLEIDGDGLSIIDLAGLDMTRFGKVVISGGDKSIISLDAAAEKAPKRKTADSRYFQLPLKRHYEREAGRLFASAAVSRSSTPQTGLTVRFEGGGRYLVYAKERLQFGRQRNSQNDVVLRFVPGTSRGLNLEHQENETKGESISREHFAAMLTREGLAVEDLGSRAGTQVGTFALSPGVPHLLRSKDGGSPREIHVAETFRLHAMVFLTHGELPELGREHVAAVGGGALPFLWQLARHSGADSACLRRISNLPQEHYVMLFRQVFIGNGRADCAILTPVDTGIDQIARIVHLADHFWLERLVDPIDCPIEVDGHEPQPGELVPLIPGQRWRLAKSNCLIEPLQQELSGY